MTQVNVAHGLGRVAAPDARDRLHPMHARLAAVLPQLLYRYWPFMQQPLDQKAEQTCVGHAWKHFMMCAPVTDRATNPPLADDIYDAATLIDEWGGNERDRQAGTSVRAGARVLQQRGNITEYLWATTVTEAADFVLQHGPVVAGTDWYDGMFTPRADGFLVPSGVVSGGHAYLLRGVNTLLRKFQLVNSWGDAWGQHGKAWLSFDTLDQLLHNGGELCTAVEVKLRPQQPM